MPPLSNVLLCKNPDKAKPSVRKGPKAAGLLKKMAELPEYGFRETRLFFCWLNKAREGDSLDLGNGWLRCIVKCDSLLKKGL